MGPLFSKRRDALKHGAKVYLSNKPCKRGHLVLRDAKGGDCRQCTNLVQRLANKRRVAILKGHTQKYYDKDPKGQMLCSAKRRAKVLEIEFDLTREDFEIPSVCPILGIPLFRNKGRMCNNSPSLDRIDPNRGYVKGNVAVISNRANTLKSDSTVDILKRLLEYMESTSGACA